MRASPELSSTRGCAPPVMSMMASRVWPRAMPRSTKVPLPSGPRWPKVAFILPRILRASGPGLVTPAMPHISLPPSRRHCRSRNGRMLRHSFDLVGRFSARLEIDPGEDFGDEPEQDEQYPGKSDRGSEQRQRRLDQGHAIAQLQHHRPSQLQKCQSPKCQTKLAEKLHRPVKRTIDEV